jgi:hypothetical protein
MGNGADGLVHGRCGRMLLMKWHKRRKKCMNEADFMMFTSWFVA